MTKVNRSSFIPTLEAGIIILWVWCVSFCMFSNFYRFVLDNEPCVALANLIENINENHTYPYLGTILKSVRLLNP